MGKYDSGELLEASRKGDYSTVEKILNHHKSKKSAFHSLRRGAGINVQDSSGYNALHHAALNGHTDIVQLLLSHDGINPNALDQRGSSALHLAAWAGHTDICKMLLKHPSLPADPNTRTAEDESPLHFASQHGHLTALIELLASGGDPNIMNIRDETPLDLAAQYGRLQIVQILIRAHNELLLPLKATKTSIQHTALHLASRNGHRDIVELLLAAGCNVNILTPSGSAMHEAALCGKEKVVKVLLREGIDLDLCDRDGRTVFDLLDEFPAHVVNRIRNVIKDYHQPVYDSESDDLHENIGRYSKRVQNSSHSGQHANSISNNSRGRSHYYRHHQDYEIYGGTTSPSSMGSFGGDPSSSPAGVLVAISTPRSAPLKPPRKSHSISPPNHSQFSLMTQSLDIDFPYHNNDQLEENDCSSSASSSHNLKNQTTRNDEQKQTPRAPYEYLYLSHSGESDEKSHQSKKKVCNSKKKSPSQEEMKNDSEYIIMNAPIKIPSNYDSKIVRVANPHRKLRRSREGYNESSNDTDTYVQVRRNPNEAPLSPTHYPKGSTPEHAPPSAEQAERYIHDRIRPLSQDYRRRSGRVDSNKSPTSASSGSLSSVSISSSTDCVEEYHGDVPFAGLFKGSIMTLNHTNPNNTFTTKRLSTFTQHLRQKDGTIQSEIKSHTLNANHDNRDPGSYDKFNEEEEWEKISEIMESFGSGIARESVFVNDMENEFRQRLGLPEKYDSSTESQTEESNLNVSPLMKWLKDIQLEHLEEYLVENGYDDPNFINGLVTNENDLEICGIPEKDRRIFLSEIIKLPKPSTFLESYNINGNIKNNNSLPSLDDWLNSIQLSEYINVFKKHLYSDMEKIFKVWEIELQAVLEINKIGHRKRILYSLIGQRLEPSNIEEINEDLNNFVDILQSDSKENNNIKIETQSEQKSLIKSSSRHKKNRPAPQPPVRKTNVTHDLEIRSPSELLLSNQGRSLQAQWKHSAATLVSGSIKYEVFYLGSTVIKELRGTESTRKSIQKLKKGILMSSSSQNESTSLVHTVKRPVCLAISHVGVQFIDIDSQGMICEHNIKNIDCACQDAEDLSHFAYITKDFDNNMYYCHVFFVDSMDLATEIILTIGQAFEVAYQLVLREQSPSALNCNAGKSRPMSLASSSSKSDH